MPEYGHWWLGQAKPSVFTRFGAPRRLFTSPQGRTGRGADPTPDERVQERRQGAIAWGAWLEETLDQGVSRCCCRMSRTMMGPAKVTKPYKRENEEEHEQKQEHIMGHKVPRRLK
jgi:hypothetical protein